MCKPKWPENNIVVMDMKSFARIYRYFVHRMRSTRLSGHSTGTVLPHDFVEKALKYFPDHPVPELVEHARKTLLASSMKVPAHLYGSGVSSGSRLDRIGRIVKRSAIPAGQGRVLFRLSAFFRPETIIELGTCVGLGTLYLSLGHPDAEVITVEGNRKLADIAGNLFRNHGLSRVRLMQCTFDEALHQLPPAKLSNALIFIDGDHTCGPTLNYFNELIERAGDRCTMIFHDIHWSEGMYRAWKEIIQDVRVRASYELYDMGILCNFGGGPVKDFVLRC